MADFELDDEELEIIRKRREQNSRDNFSVRIRDGAGNEFEGPYAKVRGWAQKTFGIDLDDEPAQDEDTPAKPAKGKGADDTVKRFAGGRRIG